MIGAKPSQNPFKPGSLVSDKDGNEGEVKKIVGDLIWVDYFSGPREGMLTLVTTYHNYKAITEYDLTKI